MFNNSNCTLHIIQVKKILFEGVDAKKNSVLNRVSIRKNFADRNEKFFFLCSSVLREKTTICAIIRKSHFAQNCHIPFLRNLSFAQFCN